MSGPLLLSCCITCLLVVGLEALRVAREFDVLGHNLRRAAVVGLRGVDRAGPLGDVSNVEPEAGELGRGVGEPLVNLAYKIEHYWSEDVP
eukprot:CAMPEP_0206234142 /NCGR_PEP_ID=MMETSP0047_2-20121206/12427_1 /ASSEMBLY_ACC=CAM_ASM_000192 /TAXON_ID=195065 /ORGANISM="Chroomonas mesostigmatica_cf, Strain CCMP1168" /LENGTH=89 /DNA_ID=CAMNT_0053658197 /DNA_START=207 /DNA_END=472 /DNA_ORIENTATION=+